MIQQQINPKYQEAFASFFENIKKHFLQSDTSIHKARNEIKIIEHNTGKCVVKSFKIPHLLNKIIYTFFRTSKAYKSYAYSLKIAPYAPEAIGYVEFRKFGLLHDSYYVSEYFDYDFTIREPLLEVDFEDRETIFKAFAKFTYELHEKEILHLDYSPGNILIKKEENGYTFKIVDINRMKFKSLSLDERLKNFAKLWIKDEDLKVVVQVYANLCHEDESLCINKALNFSRKHKNRINAKKRLKGVPVVD
ncbi:MAG TPA: hypothetical protein ENK82_06475 [Campylobacterales bacterium]|nr:hypothetical protein [Campylobacterales bacterium]HHS92975.1 hypothetical protein [Campylobacterales bacterium]